MGFRPEASVFIAFSTFGSIKALVVVIILRMIPDPSLNHDEFLVSATSCGTEFHSQKIFCIIAGDGTPTRGQCSLLPLALLTAPCLKQFFLADVDVVFHLIPCI